MGANATMTNDQATRSENGQRALSIASNDGKGASRDLSSVFSNSDSPNESNFLETKAVFNDNLVSLTGNPDFTSGVNLKYEGSSIMLTTTTSAQDRPSTKGPNLSAPSINDDGSVSTEGMENQSPVLPGGRGFGSKTVDESSIVTQERYLTRRDASESNITFGEYIDTNTYNWEA